jgi:outer membrane protein assembly factor BamD (BamD/ComL family)
MQKSKTARLILVLIGLLFALMVGCGGESPESLFGTAQFEEKQTNFTHAKELYQEIIKEHPDSEWAKKARERFKALQDLYPED